MKLQISYSRNVKRALIGTAIGAMLLAALIALSVAPATLPRPVGDLIAMGFIGERVHQYARIPQPNWWTCPAVELTVVIANEDVGKVRQTAFDGSWDIYFSSFVEVKSLHSLAGFFAQDRGPQNPVGELASDELSPNVRHRDLGEDNSLGNRLTKIEFSGAEGGVVAVLKVPTTRRSFQSCWVPLFKPAGDEAMQHLYQTAAVSDATIVEAGAMSFANQDRTSANCYEDDLVRRDGDGQIVVGPNAPCATGAWIAVEAKSASTVAFIGALVVGALFAFALQVGWEALRPSSTGELSEAALRSLAREEEPGGGGPDSTRSGMDASDGEAITGMSNAQPPKDGVAEEVADGDLASPSRGDRADPRDEHATPPSATDQDTSPVDPEDERH
jgi:hypothetical protein